MKGKRVGAARRAGRYLSAGQRKRQKKKKQDRFPVRLLVCGVIFVLLVAVKLLFPQTVGELTRSASQFIGQDADFREAFAAVGRAVAGEESVGDSLQEAYTAVFSPSEIDVNPDESMVTVSSAEEIAAAPSDAAEDKEEEWASDGDEQTMSGAYISPALPENTSLDLRDLGFCYTTPVKGTLSSAFGWREHPTEGGSRFHYGIDLAAEEGTEIVAFADGTVFATGESSTLGKYIILLHAGGYRTLYAHCSSITVTSGNVSMGEVIARVGETGSTTGPHLHFELQDGTLYLNPIYYVSIW